MRPPRLPAPLAPAPSPPPAACGRDERLRPFVAGVSVLAAAGRQIGRRRDERKLKVSDMLARAFAAEGVDHLFTLMGDANMYWSTAMAELPGMKVVHARHEHCAVAMADGYARATGKVGVASTTCGPGFTQIMTALTIAARGNVPIVVFAGDSPLAAAVVPAADRHGAAGARLRRALRRGQAHRPPARQRARGLPGGAARAAAGGAERADGHAEAGLAAPHRLHALLRPGARGAAAGARSRDRRPRRRHDRRGREADHDRRPRRHPVGRRPGAGSAGAASRRADGDVAARQGPVRRQSLRARHRRRLRQRLRARALRRGRPGDRRRRGARPLHHRGRLPLSRRAHHPDRHQPARPVAGPAHRRPARPRRRPRRRRGDRGAHEAARRLAHRLPHQRDGQADRGRFARQQGIPGAAQHRSTRARWWSSSTTRCRRTGRSWSAPATTSAW